MGEVYLAHDINLNRDVALKILPESFALDPDHLARFKREAQVLASLSHPNIAIIHGFEESSGIRALVLELVVERIGTDRNLRPTISGTERQMADLDRGRESTPLATGREGTLLHRTRRTSDGGTHHGRIGWTGAPAGGTRGAVCAALGERSSD